MIEEFSQLEWANEVRSLLTHLCFKYADLALILGEDRFFASHVLSGEWGITQERLLTFKSVIPFLKSVLLRDGIFKKSVYESSREAAWRRKEYAAQLNKEFKIYLDEVFKKENQDVAKAIAE